MTDNQTNFKANDCKTVSPAENDTQQNTSPNVLLQKRNDTKPSLPRDETSLSRLTEPIESFDQLDLRESLLRGIYAYGFERPSDIQQRALKACILGYDVLAEAQSGTGKTPTYINAILQQLDMDCKDCQALILAPARELAQGIHRLVSTLGEYMNVTCHACIGGTNVREDKKRLEAGVQVVVSTPGRILDMLKRSALCTEKIKMLVIDGADELQSRGFDEQIYDIFKMLPENIQVIVVSATMPCDLLEITAKYMNDPVKIIIKREDRTLEGILQFYVTVEREEWKLDTLYELLDALTLTQTIIYCNTRKKVDWLTEKLRERNLIVSSLYLDMDAKQSSEALKEFRTGSSRILIRTDAIGDVTDIPQVSPVINYDLPIQREKYISRIGRSGAFGRRGTAINFITNDEQQTLHEIEKYYNTQIKELPANLADLI